MRTRRCYLCKTKVPEQEAVMGQLKAFCCMDHLLQWAKSDSGKEAVKKAYKRETKEIKEKLKSRSDWLREAQTAFNGYIRIRDKGKSCVSCGKPDDGSHQRHASHYRPSVNRAVTFNTYNVHASCAQCNTMKSGNLIPYRAHLIEMIGEEKVLWLESQTQPHTHEIEYLKRIKTIFARKKRIYERYFRG
jgi:hypothetical protein